MVNRRMFRPGFPDVKEQASPARISHTGPAPSKKPAPPEMTHAENFYWVKQMQSHTPMVVVLDNGEVPPRHRRVVRPRLHQAHAPGQPQPAHFQARHQVCSQRRRRSCIRRRRVISSVPLALGLTFKLPLFIRFIAARILIAAQSNAREPLQK